MHVKNLILALTLPLLPSGFWSVGRSTGGTCERAFETGDPLPVREILMRDYGLRKKDLVRLCEGTIITAILPTADKHQMTLLGIVRLDATAAQFARHAADFEQLVATEHVTARGEIDFSDLDGALQAFPIMADDICEVPTCRIGDCDVKLPRNVIHQMAQLDPASSRFELQVAEVIRSWLYQYLSSYRSEGNVALVFYADKDPPQSLQEGFGRLIADAQILAYRVPLLYDYFNRMVDRSSPVGMRESFVWSVEQFGMRPLTTVTHSVVYRDSIAETSDVWVAMKLLYASHYLHASLRVLRVVEDRSSAEPTSYLVCLDRLLFDSKVGGLKRTLVKRRLRTHLAERIGAIKDSLGGLGSVMARQREGQR